MNLFRSCCLVAIHLLEASIILCVCICVCVCVCVCGGGEGEGVGGVGSSGKYYSTSQINSNITSPHDTH